MPDAELLAVSKIEGVLALTDLVKSFVKAGDTFPSYDGDLCIQPHGDSKKDLEIVRVQIKGHFAQNAEEFGRDSVTYQAEITDLENYKRNGGVLFFYSIAFGSEQRVFYNSLVPTKLERMLEGAEGKSTKAIPLTPLPREPHEVEEVVLNHCSDMKMQFSFCDMGSFGATPRVLPPGSRYTMRYTSIASNEYEAASHVWGKELSIYIESEDFPIPVPTGEIARIVEMNLTRQRNVSVNGEVYYSNVLEVLVEGGRIIRMGGIEVSCPDAGGGKVSYTFDSSETFRGRLKSLRFLDAIASSGGFEIDGVRIELPGADMRTKLEEVGFAEALRFYRDAADVLKALGDEDDFNVGEVTGKDRRNVAILKRGLVDEEGIDFVDDGYDSTVCSIHLFERHYLILYEKRPDGLFDISDFVSKEMETARIYEETGEVFKITKFGYAPPSEYMDVANLRSRNLVESCVKAGYNVENCDMANIIGLELLRRFDDEGSLDDLEAAADLFGWLASSDNSSNSDIYAVNDLQVKYRKGSMTDSDRAVALRIIDSDNSKLRGRRANAAACYALLGDAKKANSVYRSLNKSVRDEIGKYPIGNVIKGTSRFASEAMRRPNEREYQPTEYFQAKAIKLE